MPRTDDIVAAIRQSAHRLSGDVNDHHPLLEMIGDARIVLLGEASHGTHEFYFQRAQITERLILEKGFQAIAVEADWPDAWRINQFVRGAGVKSVAEALSTFQRFPTWMWRNQEIRDLALWLQRHNRNLPGDKPKVGFYGMDLYSMHRSRFEVVQYLAKVDPDAAKQAMERYACFDHFGEDPQAYGYAASANREASCEDEAIKQLVELQRRAAEYASQDGELAAEEAFHAEQNAKLVKDAEEYYRAMFRGRVNSWNLRDRHMADTLDALMGHLERQGAEPKIVVWAHNSHLGDARATEMGRHGEWNVGQLMRERHGEAVRNVGFTTYDGTVMAADDWDGEPHTMRVRTALSDSYELLMHETGIEHFYLPLRNGGEAAQLLREPRLERAIGVIYRPGTERQSHYFQATLPEQFDAIIHIDTSRALEPLSMEPAVETEELPETYPTGV
jgi:erythromycin esterase-like protein